MDHYWSYMYMDYRYNFTNTETVDGEIIEKQKNLNYTLIKTCIPDPEGNHNQMTDVETCL